MIRRRLMTGFVALLGLAGCSDEYYVGLGHTYAQMETRSRDFEYRQKTPARWILGPGRVHLDLGGAWFVLEDANTSGVANHPDPNLENLEATDWSASYAIDVDVDSHEFVGLDETKSPRRLLDLMDAVRAVGWVSEGPLPMSPQEVVTVVAATPYRATWVFVCPASREAIRPTPCPAPPPLNADGTEPKRASRQPYLRLILRWEPEDSGKADFERRGLHMTVQMKSGESFDVRLVPPFRP